MSSDITRIASLRQLWAEAKAGIVEVPRLDVLFLCEQGETLGNQVAASDRQRLAERRLGAETAAEHRAEAVYIPRVDLLFLVELAEVATAPPVPPPAPEQPEPELDVAPADDLEDDTAVE